MLQVQVQMLVLYCQKLFDAYAQARQAARVETARRENVIIVAGALPNWTVPIQFFPIADVHHCLYINLYP